MKPNFYTFVIFHARELSHSQSEQPMLEIWNEKTDFKN